MTTIRKAFGLTVVVVGVAATSGVAAAAWATAATGAGAAKAGGLLAPTAVSTTACTGSKVSGNFSAVVDLAWTISASGQAQSQVVSLSAPATATVTVATLAPGVATAHLNVSSLSANTVYTLRVTALRQTWTSASAVSSNTFSLANNNGACTRA